MLQSILMAYWVTTFPVKCNHLKLLHIITLRDFQHQYQREIFMKYTFLNLIIRVSHGCETNLNII